MQVEVSEPRKFKSVVVHRGTANDAKNRKAVFTFQKILVDDKDTEVKVEEQVNVAVTDDKVQVSKSKPAEQRQPGMQQAQTPPEVVSHAKTGQYTKLMDMKQADAAVAVGEEYVLPLYQ
jgi:hypothetical protein